MSGNRHLVNIDHQLEYKIGSLARGRPGKGHERPAERRTGPVWMGSSTASLSKSLTDPAQLAGSG